MTNSNFDTLRTWASEVQKKLGTQAKVSVQEPKFANSGLAVDLVLERTVAQILLWPSGMLDLCVLSTEGTEDINEHYTVVQSGDLARILDRMTRLVQSTERGAASKR